MTCLMVVLSGFVFTACNDDNDVDTNQFTGGVKLNVFGPSPVARGGELRFIGSGMNQIQGVTIPGCDEIVDIKVISPEEIRVTVPQTAEPGIVTLRYANGKITTKTVLNYTEPISIEDFSPKTIKAGQELTISGEYLNLINEVIFADEVIVPAEEFVSQSRSEIKVIVPAEAQTGKFIISDGAEIPNWIYSDEELNVVLPSVENVLDLTDAKPGDEITVTGEDLDLVVKVVMPNDDEIDFDVDGDKLTFTLPANASDGAISMVAASGVKVAIATIGVAVPEECVADPATGIWAGDVIKIKGVNMELVTDVIFPNVADAVTPDSKSATEITLTVPAGAQSGDIILNTGSGATVAVPVETLRPENIVYNPSPAALAGNLTISGRNLQNVVKIIFAEGTAVEVENANATDLTIVVPATLPAGDTTVAFELSNGETVSGPNVELTAPECAYATVLPGDDVEIRAGETAVFTIANEDKLTAVKVNGQEVQYILNGTTLIVQIPTAAGANSTVTLVSSNGEISYNLAVIPMTHVGMTIWEGMDDIGEWGGNQDLAWGGYDWSQVPDGAKMTLYMTPTVADSEWWCVSLRHADGWGNIPGLPGQYDTPENGILEVTLTREILDDLIANNGLVVTGYKFVLNKITIEWEISLETVVPFTWKDQDMGSYSINLESGPGSAFIDAGIEVGQTMRIYATPTAAYDYDDPQVHIQMFDGHWGALTFPEIDGGGQFNEVTWGDMKCVEITITPELYEKFTTLTDWGYCIIFQGKNIILNKVTLQ